MRIGVVSFLNSRPLIAGLADRPEVALEFAPPADLPARLMCGAVDAALIPIVDVLRAPGALRIVSDACIGCDGETMTVRVFSQTPPDRIRTLAVDRDSHTSILLARVLWRALYGRDLELVTIAAGADTLAAHPAVLLIGDKVIDPRRAGCAYEVDLGGAWRQHTGLPFTFAVWAMRRPPAGSAASAGDADARRLAQLLAAARDRGVAQADEIAAAQGPALGWPVALAQRYLTRCLRFRLTPAAVAGVELFARRLVALGELPAAPQLAWPPLTLPAEATT